MRMRVRPRTGSATQPQPGPPVGAQMPFVFRSAAHGLFIIIFDLEQERRRSWMGLGMPEEERGGGRGGISRRKRRMYSAKLTMHFDDFVTFYQLVLDLCCIIVERLD